VTVFATAALAVALLAMPAMWIAIDVAPFLRARRGPDLAIGLPDTPRHDFSLLVPIYGSTRYLENVDFLKAYGSRVVLCTTSQETDDFLRELGEIALAGNFRVLVCDDGETEVAGDVVGRRSHSGGAVARATAGSKRDRVIRAALELIRTEYVVCIDADTMTEQPIDVLVGALAERQLDFASVQLVASNRTDTLVTRLQAHEYMLAMKLRRVCPWLVSGACHVARTVVHREVMRRHTLFFQANDVEAGLLAQQLGYRVGHIPFVVPTAVPSTARALLRQRYAWVGGEFRLFAVNWRYARHHLAFFLYGLGLVIVMFPLRWFAVVNDSLTTLLVLFAVYIAAITWLCWHERDYAVVVMPFYTLVSTMLLVPLGALSYIQMARASRNRGVIRLEWSRARALAASARLFDAAAFNELRAADSIEAVHAAVADVGGPVRAVPVAQLMAAGGVGEPSGGR